MIGNRSRRARSTGLGSVERLGGLVTRRSRLVLVVWIVSVAALGMLGLGLESKLTTHPLFVEGTQAERAHEIAEREFGSDFTIVVMLRGPSEAVERQGRLLATRLSRMPRALVITPWSRGGTVDGLRPSPRVAGLIVRIETEKFDDLLPPVRRQVDATVAAPVQASLAGLPVVAESLLSASKEASRTGEMIAIPVLLIVLLLMFRSVFAAMVPVIMGGAVLIATRGVLSLLVGFVDLDLFASAVVAMMGLALGVDYSLLVVSRFREEYKGGDPTAAVLTTVQATFRAVIPAGCGLVLAMVAALLLLPGTIVLSIAIAVITVALLSMISAICVVPALLARFGRSIDRWMLPVGAGVRPAPLHLSRRIVSHPGAVAAIMVALIFCAGLAFNLNSSVANIALLPKGDQGRQEQESVEDGLGSGWLAPMEIVVNGQGTPLTSPGRLRALADFQHRVERDPGVDSMAGFAPVQRGAEKIYGLEGELAKQERGMARLGTVITQLNSGATSGSKGLHAAAEGSKQLGSGIGAARAGAGVLADALQKTSAGSDLLAQGLGQVDTGSGRLAGGATKASSGASRIADGLSRAQDGVGEIFSSTTLLKNAMGSGEDRLDEVRAPLQNTEAQLAAAWRALQRMTSGRTDPEYAAVLAAIEEADRQLTGTDIRTGEPSQPPFGGVAQGIERADGQFGVGTYLTETMEKNGSKADEGIGKLSDAAAQLAQGLDRLDAGSQQLSQGIAALNRGGEALSPAMRQLSEGAGHLAGGLGQLEAGAGKLSDGLGSGADKSEQLTAVFDRLESGLQEQRGGAQFDRLQENSPGLFRSAYFVLAGLDGSRPERRRQLGTLINLDRGGLNGRMLVIPRDEPESPEAAAVKERLEDDSEQLGDEIASEVVVGGSAPLTIDANNVLRDNAPWMRIALSLVSLIILIPVMRSLLVPLLAALFNLVAVSATFGLLSLLFNTSLLGGPGFVDATVLLAGMIVMFGLAIDYEVFVFARIREEYLRTGSTSAAVRNGLDRTAHVVTGAAMIMIAAFLAFSITELITIRNFGVALAIAVFIDAFIVRLIFVPVMMERLGRWCWWIPSWLDRLLPGRSSPAGATTRPAAV